MANNRGPGMGGNMFQGNGNMFKPNMFEVDNLDFTGITLPEGVTEEQIKDILKQVIEKNNPAEGFDNNAMQGGFRGNRNEGNQNETNVKI